MPKAKPPNSLPREATFLRTRLLPAPPGDGVSLARIPRASQLIESRLSFLVSPSRAFLAFLVVHRLLSSARQPVSSTALSVGKTKERHSAASHTRPGPLIHAR